MGYLRLVSVCMFYGNTERVVTAVTPVTYIPEVFVSNLGLDIGYPKGFRGFPQFLYANVGVVPRLVHDRFLPSLL
jgi:hypothetical protein